MRSMRAQRASAGRRRSRGIERSAPLNAASRGRQVFEANCAACHGDRGEGKTDIGAPRLSDPIWLNGGDMASVVASIVAPRNGVMPAWTGRLDAETIKMLAVYVHALGGGK